MGTSNGIATFKDGTKKYFDYQDTSDQVVSGLASDPGLPALDMERLRLPLIKQPKLAEMWVDYSDGISWFAWCDPDANQVILNFNEDDAVDFRSAYSFAADSDGTVHLIEEVSGFGFSSSKSICGFDGDVSDIDQEQAEGRLCLKCLNELLGLNNLSAIEQVHIAARSISATFMDEEVFDDKELNLCDLSDDQSIENVYINVPVKNVVSLGRNDFWFKGDTWRSTTFNLHGRDWEENVLTYFVDDIRENLFPPSESRGILELYCVGGACEVVNGNHRLVGAKAWLANLYGEQAYLKKVKVSGNGLHPLLKPLLLRAKQKQSKVHISMVLVDEVPPVSFEGLNIKAYIQLGSDKDIIYAWTTDQIKEINLKTSLLDRLPLRGKKSWFDEREKLTIPTHIVSALLCNEWLVDQISADSN
jgi:hypothetical protein